MNLKKKISNQFLVNYLIAFMLSIFAAISAVLLLSFASDVLSRTLVKNNYPASAYIQDDYTKIDASPILENGGGIQIINKNHEVVYSRGINTLNKDKFTTSEFTDFLIYSKSVGIKYHYDILYNSNSEFWMIVTFPVSIRLDLALTHNEEASSKDMQNVATAIISVIILYLLLLALFAVIYSRITAVRITGPLQKLRESTKRLREKDYSARVDLNLNNEFADLQETFNEMAEKIEIETSLRQKSEEERKRLVLDVSHDLKNPLTSTAGYAELCLTKTNLSDDELRGYLEIIRNNSLRASELLTDLFELSKLESAEFHLSLEKTDVSEYLRQVCGEMLPNIEQSGFSYEFDIPEESVFSMIDVKEIDRVFHNLMDNAIRYNPKGTSITISMSVEGDRIIIYFKDNGAGIPKEFSKDIFKPFVRVDASRNSKTGGTGLGLSIAFKIIEAHNGELVLDTDVDAGACFKIVLPKI